MKARLDCVVMHTGLPQPGSAGDWCGFLLLPPPLGGQSLEIVWAEDTARKLDCGLEGLISPFGLGFFV
jgi:hypothetical protein